MLSPPLPPAWGKAYQKVKSGPKDKKRLLSQGQDTWIQLCLKPHTVPRADKIPLAAYVSLNCLCVLVCLFLVTYNQKATDTVLMLQMGKQTQRRYVRCPSSSGSRWHGWTEFAPNSLLPFFPPGHRRPFPMQTHSARI